MYLRQQRRTGKSVVEPRPRQPGLALLEPTMTLSQPFTTAKPLLGHPPAELAFRIHGGSENGRIVQVAGERCLVGSAAECSLRFQAAGVRPRHCLILRGAARTIIRRLSPDTRLNGHDFDDGLLAAGDRIAIGPFELEVLQDAPERRSSRAATLDANQALLDESGQASVVTDRKGLQAELAAQSRAIKLERIQWRVRQEELEARWAARKQALRDEIEQVRAAAVADKERQQAEFAVRYQELQDERMQWHARQRELETQWVIRERLLRDENAQVCSTSEVDRERLQAELLAVREELDQVGSAWEARQQELETQWPAREQALRDETEQVRAAAATNWDRLKVEFANQLQARQQELETNWAAQEQTLRDEIEQVRAAAAADRERLQAEFANQCRALQDERTEWQARQQQLETQWATREQALRDETDQVRAAAAADRERLESEFAEHCQALEGDQSQSQARQQEVASQWATREQALRDETEQVRAAAAADRERLQDEFAIQCQALQEERTEWQARQQELETKWATREQALRDETEQVRAAAAADRERLQAEFANQCQALQDERTERQARQQELETQWATREQALRDENEQVRTVAAADRERLQAELQERYEQFEAERAALKAREQRRVIQWAACEQTLRLEAERARSGSDAVLSRLRAELEAQHEIIEHERTSWLTQRNGLEARAAERERVLCLEHERARTAEGDELRRLRAEVASLSEALEHERAARQADRLENSSKWTEREHAVRSETLLAETEKLRGEIGEDVARLQAELDGQRAALEQERAERQVERLERESQWIEREREVRAEMLQAEAEKFRGQKDDDLARLQAELDDQRAALAQERAERQAEQLERESQWIERERAVRTEMLRTESERVRGQKDDDDARPQAESDDERATVERDPEELPRRHEAARQDESGEDSIDDYMSKLMERLGRKTAYSSARPAPVPVVDTPHVPEPSPSEPSPSEPTPSELSEEEAVDLKPAPPIEMRPRAMPAERSVDFSAMRELANLNARTAIDAHGRRQAEQRGIGKVAAAGAACVAACILLWLYQQGNETAFPVAMMCLAVAAIGVLQYATAVHRSRPGREAAKWIEDSLVSKGENGGADSDDLPTDET